MLMGFSNFGLDIYHSRTPQIIGIFSWLYFGPLCLLEERCDPSECRTSLQTDSFPGYSPIQTPRASSPPGLYQKVSVMGLILPQPNQVCYIQLC